MPTPKKNRRWPPVPFALVPGRTQPPSLSAVSYTHLDVYKRQGWGYAVFGTITEGTDVVDKIKGVKTGNKGFHQNVPNEDVIIEKAEVLE